MKNEMRTGSFSKARNGEERKRGMYRVGISGRSKRRGSLCVYVPVVQEGKGEERGRRRERKQRQRGKQEKEKERRKKGKGRKKEAKDGGREERGGG
jgi:hypothetical protein